jgi:hypothetical protein
MRRFLRRHRVALLGVLVALAGVPLALRQGLRYQPDFYRERVVVPPERRRAEAQQFVAQSVQLRNDIMNEAAWEASFSDEEVNAWLAEDLVEHFADQIPPGVSEPRVAFEPDRAILAFQLDQGALKSVVWVVARLRVTAPNELALTLEKVRAGVVPVPYDGLLDRVTAHARAQGVAVTWDRTGPSPVATITYRPTLRRTDIRLEQIQFLQGRVRLAGRSERREGDERTALLRLPGRDALRAQFPRATHQPSPSGSVLRRASRPESDRPERRSVTESGPQDSTL